MKSTQDNPLSPFLLHLQDRDRSPRTVQAYASDLKDFRYWFEANTNETLRPESVTSVDLQAYRHHLLEQGRSPATINRRLAAIRAWLRWANEQGLIAEIPEIQGVRQQPLAPRWLEPKEARQILREAERAKRRAKHDYIAYFLAVRNWAMLTLLFHTGLRAAELTALRLENVTLRKRSGHIVIRGKGRKERLIPLNHTARLALQEWLNIRNERISISANPYVFVSQKWGSGKPMSHSTLWRIFHSIAQDAGIQASPHTFRHTLAKQLIEQGIGLEKVATILGHESLDTTRRYIEPGESDLREALESIE